MKPEVRIILALSFSLAACGHSKPDLFLEQTTTALECASSSAPECVSGDDAGAPHPAVDECYGDGDCEYGEVCERRHGLSLCQPEDGDDGSGGYGGDDSSSDDDGYDDSSSDDGYGDDDSSSDDDGHGHGGHGGDDAPDGGSAACDPAYSSDDSATASGECAPEHHDEYEDRSGSNSGPH